MENKRKKNKWMKIRLDFFNAKLAAGLRGDLTWFLFFFRVRFPQKFQNRKVYLSKNTINKIKSWTNA